MNHMACGLVEIKLDPGSNTESMTFEGYGAVFGNVDAYGDVIEPGAFASYLSDARGGRQPWPAMLAQHGGWGMGADDMTPIGVWTDLAEDGKGLKVAGQFADTPRGREMFELMRMKPRPAIDGLSIGYIAKEWSPRSKPEEPRRRLKRIDLVEISPVTFPANRMARVASVKSIEDLQTLRDIEDFMCEQGLSKKQAVALISRIKSAVAGDPDGAAGGPGDPVAELVGSLQKRARLFA